jgi:hypothetical protein
VRKRERRIGEERRGD